MTSDGNGIIFLADHYFFLKTSSLTQDERNTQRRTVFEKQAIKALIKFSKEDRHSLTDYFPEEQNEMMSWINVAISECSKTRNQK